MSSGSCKCDCRLGVLNSVGRTMWGLFLCELDGQSRVVAVAVRNAISSLYEMFLRKGDENERGSTNSTKRVVCRPYALRAAPEGLDLSRTDQ